jgi:hypothetical protein
MRIGTRHHLSRRALLGSIGSAAVLAPFVPLLEAHAQTVAPKRLVLFFTPHATHWPSWMMPASAGTNVQLGPILQPLTPYQNKLAFIRGLGLGTRAEDLPNAHSQGFAELWTGSRREANTFASSISVDQYIANSLNPPTKYRTLELGVQCLGADGGNSRMIYAGPSQPMDPEQNPQDAFARLFGTEAAADGTPNAAATAAAAAQSAQQKSVLDLVLSELGSLQASVSQADRMKLQTHAQSIRDLETSLQAAPSTGCAAPVLSTKATPNLGGAPDMPLQLQQQMDILVAALACDMTRIASLQVTFGDNDNLFPYTWLGIPTGHHSLTHMTATTSVNAQLDQIYTWYSQQFLYLLQKMDSVAEGDGTLLDNTLIVWGTELGTYLDHMSWPLPIVMAGFSGRLKAGQYIDTGTNFVQHNRLLVSICNEMGLPNVTTFGAMDIGSGPLPGLFA